MICYPVDYRDYVSMDKLPPSTLLEEIVICLRSALAPFLPSNYNFLPPNAQVPHLQFPQRG